MKYRNSGDFRLETDDNNGSLLYAMAALIQKSITLTISSGSIDTMFEQTFSFHTMKPQA